MSNIDKSYAFSYHMNQNPHGRRGRCLSSFLLRTIALMSMIVDHAGLALFPRAQILRCVGRLSFPLYCFLLVQGYSHTRDLRAYARRLLLLALLSEVPFDLLIFGRVASAVEQNVCFSLLLGLGAVYVADRFRDDPARMLPGLMMMFTASMAVRVSYGWLGIALCLCFYVFRGRNAAQVLGLTLIEVLYCLSLLLSGVKVSWVLISLCAMCSAVPIALYSGKPGLRHPLLSTLFYAAYPLHILALLLIRAMRIVPPYFFG